MVLGGFAIFGMFSEVLPTAITNPFIIVLFVFLFIVLPILGNLYPRYISFLLSMRYYAGTWAYSIWLFKDDAKLKVDEHVTKTSPSVEWQLSVLYDDHTYKSMLSRLIGFRMLHTPSRLINRLYIFLPMGLHLTQSVTPAVLIAYGQQHIAERAVQPKKSTS